jgi:hypothetical protein
MKISLRFMTAALAMCAAISSTRGAEAALETIREGEIKQQGVQADAQRVAAELQAMTGEYQRNGIASDEVQTLQALSKTVTHLSREDMQKVLDLLGQARNASTPQGALQPVANAYSVQKNVIVQFKQMLARYQRDQSASALADTVSQLAERQQANFKTAVELGNWAQDKSMEEFTAALEASVAGQQSEQQALVDELKQAMQTMETAARESTDPAKTARLQAALAKARQMAPILEAANAELKEKHLFQAAALEKKARDELRKLARDVAPTKDSSEALRAAAEEVNRMAQQQQQIRDQAKNIYQPEATIEEWIKNQLPNPKSEVSKIVAGLKKQGQTPAELAGNSALREAYKRRDNGAKQQLADLQAPQTDVAARADLVNQDLQAAAPAVADLMKKAMEQMQQTQAGITEQNAAATAAAAEAAAAALEQAKAELQKKIAEADAEKNGDRTKQLEALKEQMKQTRQDQEKLAGTPPGTPAQNQAEAAKQAELAKQAAELAEKAKNAAPEAEAAVRKAAESMNQAAQAMKDPAKAAEAAPAQQAAAAELAKAEQKVNEALAEQQAAAETVAKAKKAGEDLGVIIAKQEKLEIDTTQATGQKPVATELLRQHGRSQSSIRHETTQFESKLEPELKTASSSLLSAAEHMQKASHELAKPDGNAAKPEQRAALEDLYKARELIAQIGAAAQQQVDQANQQNQQNAQNQQQPQEQQQQAAGAQQNLEQAQAQTAEGQQQLEQAQKPGGEQQGEPTKPKPEQMQAAAEQFAQAAQNVGEAASSPDQNMTPETREALSEARNQLSEASAAAKNQQMDAAQKAAQQAQEQIQQALNSMSQNQSGIAASDAPLPPSAQQQPNENPQGQTSNEQPLGAGSEGQVATAGTGVAGKGKFLGLPARDRVAVEQGQAEKVPEEFASLVQQYMENLAVPAK